MKQGILFPSLPTGEEHTCKQQNIESLSQDVSLSPTFEDEKRERDILGTREIRDQGRFASFLHQTPQSLISPLTRGTQR